MRVSAGAWVLFATLAPGTASRPEGTRIRREFSSEFELRSESFEVVGSEDGRSETQHPPSQVRSQSDVIEIVDTLEAGAEDPSARFTREYRTVQSSLELGDERSPRARTGATGLEGKRIHFERDGDGGFTRTSDDTDVKPGQLRRLRAELELAPLLPAVDVASAPGTQWELAPAYLLRWIAPLEEGPPRPRPRPRGTPGGLDLSPAVFTEPMGALLGALEGELTATRVAPDEDDEFPCRARLEFRLTSTFEGAASVFGPAAREASDEVQSEYRGSGTLAWDPETGARALSLEGELRLVERFSAEVEGNGKTAELQGEVTLAGAYTLEARESRE